MSNKEDLRTRIIDAAERCFYTHGITATGVDTLAEEADVSKRTLYNHFGSKDGLVTAYLQRREDRWRRRLAGYLEHTASPMDRLLAYVRAYCDQPADDGYRGCPFINAAAEVVDENHPAVAVIRDSVARVERDLTSILEEVGVEDPVETASRVLLVLEGAMGLSGIRRTRDAYDTAQRLVESIVTDRHVSG